MEKQVEKGRSKEIVCNRCGRTRPHHCGGLCASCYVAEYKKKNNYKGPLGICSSCGLKTNIHAKGMCNKCYSKAYDSTHKEERAKRDKLARETDPEKFRRWRRQWVKNNRERRIASDRSFRERNRERLRAAGRLKRLQCKERQIEKTSFPLEKEIALEIIRIPEMKRIWVVEFIKTVFDKRAPITKRIFLRDINRLIFQMEKDDPNRAKAGWNAVSLADVDRCQVETGVLKDSLRVYFRWLHQRKGVVLDLSTAIPVAKIKRRAPNVKETLLKELYSRWIGEKDSPDISIAGLLIIYFGMSNEELRLLTVDDFANGEIYLNDEWVKVDTILWRKIESYLKWRQTFYFGFAPKYFFVTAISVAKNKPVSVPFFSSRFKDQNIPVTPSELRKAMIHFHRRHSKCDFAVIGSLFRIQAKSAAAHFSKS